MMLTNSECQQLVHPFQTDPGVSQPERVIDDLLSGPAAIDGRTMAGLLDYFVALSQQINYYDSNLVIEDWQPFFKNSLPFTLAGIINYNGKKARKGFESYNKLFDGKPTPDRLQLVFYYVYNNSFRLINNWWVTVKETGLPLEGVLARIIRDKLQQPVKTFISHANAASSKYRIKKIDFSELQKQDIWNLQTEDLYAYQEPHATPDTRRNRLIALRDALIQVFPVFQNTLSESGKAAGNSMEQSFFPLKEELQKKHPPHLGLLFAFLKLFQHLQGDLNRFTKKHLDYFYQDVLRLQVKGAVADKAHIVFEIQKVLDQYLLKQGLLVKDGKDINKMEVLFSLDEEIVVNKTQVIDVRTLFLNNQTAHRNTYVEGVYMAPDARKADGVKAEFKDSDPGNWYTLGNKLSKYTDPGTKLIRPYPDARLGFILASPVLLLNEGTRKVTITLDCQLHNDYCKYLADHAASAVTQKNCCQEDISQPKALPEGCDDLAVTTLLPACNLYQDILDALNKVYYYVSVPLIRQAVKQGAGDELVNLLQLKLSGGSRKICYCETPISRYDAIVKSADFQDVLNDPGWESIKKLFPQQKVFKVSFSGAKDWIDATEQTNINFTSNPVDCSMGPGPFPLTIQLISTLGPELPAVTFYDKDKLKEDFDTIQPVVRIELNEKLKIIWTDDKFKNLEAAGSGGSTCCLEKDISVDDHPISLYHFFRNVVLSGSPGSDNTSIEVEVCGLKNFVVQNDESIQNINGPIYPFGTRPEIIDFDIKNPPAYPPVMPPFTTTQNLIGPDFYIGSVEVFCKKWEKVYINLNWKDKPTDFHDYYKAYLKDPISGKFGLDADRFLINLSILQEGEWKKENSHALPSTVEVIIQTQDYNDRLLFHEDGKAPFCPSPDPLSQTLLIKKDFFTLQQRFRIDQSNLNKYDVGVRNGFLKINLQLQDFCHKVYSYVLARQMMALGKLPDSKIEDAIYYDATVGGLIVFSTNTIKNDLADAGTIADRVESDINDPANGIKSKAGLPGSGPIATANANSIRRTIYPSAGLPPTVPGGKDLTGDVLALKNKIAGISGVISNNDKFQAIIPNEPWTPVLKNISLDYSAKATIEDITLIHIHPYDGTYQHVDIQQQPTLFPLFCDEGTLFLGLQDLVPGSNLSILFQLAEATADSESVREELQWSYLANNEWKPLRKGFEVLEDATDGLTTSGIVKLATPGNMTSDNTILPNSLHWIKASLHYNSKTISETVGIFAQAVRATFTNDPANDKSRLSQPLPQGSISKLRDADTAVKKVSQPYDSFGGRVPEIDGHYYIRVSELLRHKGRAIQKWDYERLTLEGFPQVFRVKCINHSYGLDAHKYLYDFPAAPGYVLLGVIPDITQLESGNSYQPKVPVSMLEEITRFISSRTSPFVRLKTMNPRYEAVTICITIKLVPGKDENYYREKLKEDIRGFMAPWSKGDQEALLFAQSLDRSDLVRFLESLDYVDYVIELKMAHEQSGIPSEVAEVCPLTPRSILVAGEIDVCIRQQDCEKWDEDYPCKNPPIPVKDYCPKPEPIII